jgi:tetratricopeptide (TPR) repeat protein
MTTTVEALNAAIAVHQSGRAAEAEALYRQIVAADPSAVDGWNLLGIACFQQGRAAEAIDCLRRAIELRPEEAQYFNNLGEACRAFGRLEESIAAYRRAIELKPTYPEAFNNLGIALSMNGDPAGGLAQFDEALRLRPEFADAHYNRGLALRSLKRLDESIAASEAALRIKPDMAGAWNNLGLIHQEQRRLEQSVAAFREALRLSPNLAEVHNNLGNTLKLQKQLEASVVEFRRAIELNPRLPEAHNNLAAALKAEGKFAEAMESYARAIELRPNYVEAITNLGNALKDQLRFDEAMRLYERALELDPGHVEAHISRAIVRLVHGDFERGFPEFECRWHRAGFSLPRPMNVPLWDGSDPRGRTILLVAEQGLGDSLNFVRYATLLAQRGAKVLLVCQPPLVKLLKTVPGVAAVLTQDEPHPACDIYAQMASLPGICQTRRESIPNRVPYVFADPAAVARWRAELGSAPGLKVGIAWQGNRLHTNDRWRSLRLESLGFLQRPDVRVVSLQKDPTDADRALLERLGAVDLDRRLTDMSETAAVVKNLDLVISCDSAMAHLAGAIGAKVWVAIPFAPDWRWLLERDDCPWYPTMRLFRQPKFNDWPAVLQNLAQALDAECHSLAARRP